MDLREYLFREKMKVSDFAKKINYSRIHVNEVMLGTRKPGKGLALTIHYATDGKVSFEEVMKSDT